MHRLVVNPDTAQQWEIHLKEGMNFLGSGTESEVPIEHPTVSPAHCEVLVAGAEVTLRDLESPHGTFVDGQRVRETALRQGQTLRLGDVLLRFEGISSTAIDAVPGASDRPAGSTAPKSGLCRYHRHNYARYTCPQCGFSFCELCVSVRRDRGETRGFCRACSVECTAHEIMVPEDPGEQLTFAQMARRAFTYPFNQDGALLLFLGGFILLLINLANLLSAYALLLGVGSIFVVTVFGTGFLVSFLREIITTSAAGEDKLPNWPDATDIWGELIVPFLQLAGTVIVCFAPALFLTALAPENSPWLGWVLTVLLLAGCVYFPMAFLGVAMFDSVGAVNPLLVVPSIMKIAGSYFTAIAIFAFVLLMKWVADTLLPSIFDLGLTMRILLWVISNFVGIYLLVVEARILGVLYRAKQDELGWFN